MPPLAADHLFSLPVVVTDCQPVFDKWRRRHRKRRIDKKWKARYGYVTRCVHAGTMYTCFKKLVVCKCTEKKIREAIDTHGPGRRDHCQAPAVKEPPFRLFGTT